MQSNCGTGDATKTRRKDTATFMRPGCEIYDDRHVIRALGRTHSWCSTWRAPRDLESMPQRRAAARTVRHLA
jgi:hypothetical protein